MDVWGVSSKIFQKTVVEGPDFFKVAEIFLQKGTDEEKILFVRLARKIWFRRNSFVFHGLFTHPNDLLKETHNSINAFQKANGDDCTGERMRAGQVAEKWQAPAVGWHKANWDAARDTKKGQLGVGIVIRDQVGRVVAAKCIPIQGQLEPNAIEALAACHAVRFSKEIGVSHLILEGDAMNVVTAVNAKEVSMFKHGHLIEDLKQTLRLFSNWECRHVSRKLNKAAHGLAQEACKQFIGKTWNNSISGIIRDIVLMEQNVSV